MRLPNFLLLGFIFALLAGCTDNPTTTGSLLQSETIPPGAKPVSVTIQDLNCWSEQGRFFVAGICSNESPGWQRIWLKAEFMDASGKPVTVQGAAGAVVPTFSTAIAPKGRSAFFAGWPLSDFQGVPDSARITCSGARTAQAGTLLLVQELNGVKLMSPASEGAPATEEIAWQVNATLLNPMNKPSRNPQLELLLYGKDQRLWFCTPLDPGDPQLKQMVALDKPGPLAGGEQRQLGVYVYYDRLPAALKAQKIGRVEMLAFEKE